MNTRADETNLPSTPCDAGLVAFQNESHYFFLAARINHGQATEIFLEQVSHQNAGERHTPAKILATAALPETTNQVEFKIQATGRNYSFDYRTGNEFKPLRKNVDGSILSTDKAGGFQGTMLGLYARGH